MYVWCRYDQARRLDESIIESEREATQSRELSVKVLGAVFEASVSILCTIEC